MLQNNSRNVSLDLGSGVRLGTFEAKLQLRLGAKFLPPKVPPPTSTTTTF